VDQSKLFTKLEIRQIGRFVMIQKQKVDMCETTRRVKFANGVAAGSDNYFDKRREPGNFDESCGNLCEFRITL
jgi:hypothetical protein